MRARRKRPVSVEPITGYADRQSRMDYLRQKLAAMDRMRAFDEKPREFRDVWNAAGTIHNATVCWRAGCRTFDQATKAIAGVWDGQSSG